MSKTYFLYKQKRALIRGLVSVFVKNEFSLANAGISPRNSSAIKEAEEKAIQFHKGQYTGIKEKVNSLLNFPILAYKTPCCRSANQCNLLLTNQKHHLLRERK